MDLTDDDLGALAWFLARRLSPDGQPPPPVTDLLHPVDPTVLAEWLATLTEARSNGRIAQVLRDAVAARPDDEALRETAGLVPGASSRPPGARRPAALLALAAMLMLMFGVASATTAGAVLLVSSALPERSPSVVRADPPAVVVASAGERADSAPVPAGRAPPGADRPAAERGASSRPRGLVGLVG
jgi:hypothetical protein